MTREQEELSREIDSSDLSEPHKAILKLSAQLDHDKSLIPTEPRAQGRLLRDAVVAWNSWKERRNHVRRS